MDKRNFLGYLLNTVTYQNFPCYQSMNHWLVDAWKQAHIYDVVSFYYFFPSGKLKIVNQLLSIFGKLKLTGESLLMSESRRVEFNEFKKTQTTDNVVFKRSGLEHYIRMTVLGQTKSTSYNTMSSTMARSRCPKKDIRGCACLLQEFGVSSLVAHGLLGRMPSLCIQ